MRRVQVNGSAVTAGVACDLAVDEGHRTLQPALLLQRAVVAAATDRLPVIYGLPNPQGAAPTRRVGYREVGLVHRYAKVLRPSRYLARHPKLARLAPILGGPADVGYAALAALTERPSRAFAAEVMTAFDGRFDDLWERHRAGHGVIGLRDSRHLAWRYRDCPLQSYTTVGLLTRDRARLLGYVVYYLDGGRALCADLFAGDRADEVRALLAAWLRHARSAGAAAASVHCAVHPALHAGLEGLGFRRRTAAPAPGGPAGDDDRGRPLIVYAWPGVGPGALRPWYFTPGDEPYN
jgi:hypothetical protein